MTSFRKNASGFTLIELAVSLTIFGLLVRGVFSFFMPLADQKALEVTVTNEKKVAAGLAQYYLREGHLPCPAEPNATELGTQRTNCNSTAEQTGTVPFRDLGLTQAEATDGYNRPFTYAVSAQAQDPAGLVFENCRYTPVWFDEAAGVNYNRMKARFCCQPIQGDGALNVYTNVGASDSVTETQHWGMMLPSLFDSPDTISPTAGPSAVRLSYIAYVLVSHGKDRLGSYRWGSAARTAGASGPQEENANNDINFITLPMNTSGTDHFDDIVLWRTQEGVVSEFGNDSCHVP